MKKSFWGYNIAKVDENISFLETQNIKLERQVKQLTRELEEARSANTAAGAIENSTAGASGSAAAASNGAQAKIDELEARIAALMAENRALTERAASLESENMQLGARLSEASETETIERIGDICMSAYSDMNAAKQRTREQLEGYLACFWNEWQGCRDRLTELASQLEEKQIQSRESFISYADCILRAYGDMRDDSARLRDGMGELTAAEDGIREGMERLLRELDSEPPETPAEPESVETEAEEEGGPEQDCSIIDAVRILERTKKRRTRENETHELKTEKDDFNRAAAVGASDELKNDTQRASSDEAAAGRTAQDGAAGEEERPTGIFRDVNLRNII